MSFTPCKRVCVCTCRGSVYAVHRGMANSLLYPLMNSTWWSKLYSVSNITAGRPNGRWVPSAHTQLSHPYTSIPLHKHPCQQPLKILFCPQWERFSLPDSVVDTGIYVPAPIGCNGNRTPDKCKINLILICHHSAAPSCVYYTLWWCCKQEVGHHEWVCKTFSICSLKQWRYDKHFGNCLCGPEKYGQPNSISSVKLEIYSQIRLSLINNPAAKHCLY